MTVDDLARAMNKTVNKLTTIMQQLINLGMIIVKEDTIYIKNWDVYQSADKLEKIQEGNRRRQREYRERQKKNNVTQMLCNTEEKNREEKIKDKTERGTLLENESGFKD